MLLLLEKYERAKVCHHETTTLPPFRDRLSPFFDSLPLSSSSLLWQLVSAVPTCRPWPYLIKANESEMK